MPNQQPELVVAIVVLVACLFVTVCFCNLCVVHMNKQAHKDKEARSCLRCKVCNSIFGAYFALSWNDLWYSCVNLRLSGNHLWLCKYFLVTREKSTQNLLPNKNDTIRESEKKSICIEFPANLCFVAVVNIYQYNWITFVDALKGCVNGDF